MKITLTEIPIKDVYDGYVNSEINGVEGYKGRLNIRPAFQREFIYKDEQRNAVINTIRQNFPLNVMYWSVSGKDEDGNDTYELLDGQQRTLAICMYLAGDYSINYQYFHNLTEKEQNQIKDYKLQVYICEGDDKEKLNWFETINIAGAKLYPQELKNAIYSGEWVTECKKYFSKPNCPAQKIASDYLAGSSIRQDYLETALDWIADRDGLKCIADYMSVHQHDTNITDLKLYFDAVINWVRTTFPKYRNQMKGLPWGKFYNKYSTNKYDPKTLEEEIVKLILDDDVSLKKGIYEFLLSGKVLENKLNIRTFSDSIKLKVYTAQNGICKKCGKKCVSIEEMEADHIVPWSKGGHTVLENCQMLCKNCNRTKSNS